MIIELFGPPAVGKTTLAFAVRDSLAAAGFVVSLVSSARPAEVSVGAVGSRRRSRARAQLTAPLMRLAKLSTAVPSLLWPSGSKDVAGALLACLPPIGVASNIRNRRYLSNLEVDWENATAGSGITVFDQGYMSAVSSLIHLGRIVDRTKMVQALELVPNADLLVFLDAPRDILQHRLEARLGGQSRLERLFELDLEGNLQQHQIACDLVPMLRRRPTPFLETTSLDGPMLDQAVRRITTEATRIYASTGQGRAA